FGLNERWLTRPRAISGVRSGVDGPARHKRRVPLSEVEREAVRRRAGYRCEYCRVVGWELQVDHVIPRSMRRRDGGAGVPDAEVDQPLNLAAACAHCNRLKGDFTTG